MPVGLSVGNDERDTVGCNDGERVKCNNPMYNENKTDAAVLIPKKSIEKIEKGG